MRRIIVQGNAPGWGASVSPPPPPGAPAQPSPAQPCRGCVFYLVLLGVCLFHLSLEGRGLFGPPAHFAHRGLFPFWRLRCLNARLPCPSHCSSSCPLSL